MKRLLFTAKRVLFRVELSTQKNCHLQFQRNYELQQSKSDQNTLRWHFGSAFDTFFLFRKVVQSSTGTSVTRVISIDDDKPMISDAPLPAPKTPEKMISSQLETLNDNQVIRRRSSRNLLRGRVINTNKASLRNSGLNSSKETLGSSAATIKSNESPATTSQVSFSETSVSETEDRSSQQNTEIDASEGPSSINSLPQRASTTLTGSGLSTTGQDTVEVSNNINTNNSSDSIQAPMTSSPQLGIDLRRSYTNVNRAMIKKLQSTPSRANLFTPVIRKGPSLQVIANANKLSRSTTSIQIPSPQRRDASPVLESSEKKSPRKEKTMMQSHPRSKQSQRAKKSWKNWTKRALRVASHLLVVEELCSKTKFCL